MNYVVLDLEWNQGNSTMERRDEVMPFEVIEIGAVKLDENLSHISDFSRLVRPTRYHSLHFIAGKLLHITMEELASQQPFPEVCRDFLRWCGEDYVFVTWGPADLTELQRNMRWHGMGALSDGPIPFLDAQKLYSLSHLERHERLSLETAVDQCGIRKDIQFHRAYDDAYYTALILEKLPRSIFSYYSFDYFTLPKDKSAEVHVKFDTYAKYISRGFKDRHQALEDQTVMSTVCYLCGRVLLCLLVPGTRLYEGKGPAPENG